jgi:hypothetical protein
MTHTEALAWAKHHWGPKGIAYQGSNQCFKVGHANEGAWKHLGESFHSFEFAFNTAGKPVKMDHPAIQRAAMIERIEKDEANSLKPDQVSFC